MLDNRDIHKFTLFSPCLWASFNPLPHLLLVSIIKGTFIKSQYEMMKLWTKLTSNAQGSREIIVVVQVGALEALKKKRKNRVKLRIHQN
jgi:hypothetical protein